MSYKETYTEIKRKKNRSKFIEQKERGRETETETDRQTDRKTDRQTDRQKDRQTKCERG